MHVWRLSAAGISARRCRSFRSVRWSWRGNRRWRGWRGDRCNKAAGGGRKSTVSKEQIEDALYAFGEEIESNTIEVYVSRIRRKLGRDFIRTIRGLGYRLGD